MHSARQYRLTESLYLFFFLHSLIEPIEYIGNVPGLGLGAIPKPPAAPKKIRKPGEQPKKVSHIHMHAYMHICLYCYVALVACIDESGLGFN